MRKSNAEIVLRALQMGMEVELPNGKYEMFNGYTSIEAQRWVHDQGKGDWLPEKVWLNAELSLDRFIKLCEQVSEEDIFAIGANIALNEMKREK